MKRQHRQAPKNIAHTTGSLPMSLCPRQRTCTQDFLESTHPPPKNTAHTSKSSTVPQWDRTFNMVQDLWGYKYKWKGVLGPKSKCFGAHFFWFGFGIGFGIWDFWFEIGFRILDSAFGILVFGFRISDFDDRNWFWIRGTVLVAAHGELDYIFHISQNLSFTFSRVGSQIVQVAFRPCFSWPLSTLDVTFFQKGGAWPKTCLH